MQQTRRAADQARSRTRDGVCESELPQLLTPPTPSPFPELTRANIFTHHIAGVHLKGQKSSTTRVPWQCPLAVPCLLQEACCLPLNAVWRWDPLPDAQCVRCESNRGKPSLLIHFTPDTTTTTKYWRRFSRDPDGMDNASTPCQIPAMGTCAGK